MNKFVLYLFLFYSIRKQRHFLKYMDVLITILYVFISQPGSGVKGKKICIRHPYLEHRRSLVQYIHT